MRVKPTNAFLSSVYKFQASVEPESTHEFEVYAEMYIKGDEKNVS